MSQDQSVIEELRAINEEARWHAVETRDARFDGVFVYGVRSTGVYCKPSCPSRRPGRERVRFFDSCETAEAARFRACRRCSPKAPSVPDPQVEMVTRACRYIETHREGPLLLNDLSAEMGVSPHHLQRTFKSIIGITPRQYGAALRLEQFKSRVKEGEPVAGAMYDAGYGSSSRLYEKASEHLGMTPATYRRGGKGMNINYTVVDCQLGRLLIAATEHGVCAVSFGDSDAGLESSLRAEYPAATMQRAGAEMEGWVNPLLDHLEGNRPHLDLPLDLQATSFQMRVWHELRKIPYGSTRSYKEVAEAIGRPSATRAVARACATNPVALVTPCHRVIRENGGPGGYRWGLERKQSLLSREKKQATATLSSDERK